MRLSDVWDKSPKDSVQYLTSLLLDHDLAVKQFKNKLAGESDEESSQKENKKNKKQPMNSYDVATKKMVKYTAGEIVTYIVVGIHEKYFDVGIRPLVPGEGKAETTSAIAFKYTDFPDMKVNYTGQAVVCDADYKNKNMIVFIQPHPGKIIKQIKNALARGNADQIVKSDQTIKGTVIYIGCQYVLACLGGHAPGVVIHVPTNRHHNDFSHLERFYQVGEEYHFVIKSVQDGRIIGVMNTEHGSKIKPAKAAKEAVVPQTKPIEKKPAKPEAKKVVETKKKAAQAKVEPQKATLNDTTNGGESVKFEWNVPELASLTPKAVAEKRKLDLDDEGTSDLDWESSGDDDDGDDGPSKPKRLTREQRSDAKRAEEKQMRDKENELADLERTPKDEQDFEMAVVASPNSSIVWLKYMTFFLEKGDIAKAKEIGDRALQKISFRLVLV